MLHWLAKRMGIDVGSPDSGARAAAAERPAAQRTAESEFAMGNALAAQGRLEDAVAGYRRALELRPEFAEASCNLGSALKDLGRLAEAIPHYERAIALRPDLATAHFNLGVAWQAAGEFPRALTCYETAVRLEPQSAESQYALGYLYANADRRADALRCFARAIAIDPEHVEARWGHALAQLLAVCGPDDAFDRGRTAFDAELRALEGWFAAGRWARGAQAVGSPTPFRLAYQEADNRELLTRHGRLCAQIVAAHPELATLRCGTGGAEAAVRVAVVSRYFHNHSVWNALVKGWFTQLDAKRFALSAIHLGAERDPETLVAQARATSFTAGSRSLAQWARAIQAQNPDIVIYPEVGMDPMTQRLAALRLAPLQLAAWGHPETTGLPTIDYYLSAADFEPPEADAYYSERLVRLPGLGCYVEPRPGTAAGAGRGDFGLDEDRPLLICPGTPFKYAPQHDELLVRIAALLRDVQFAFFRYSMTELSYRLQRRLEAAFARAGLDPARHLRFLPWQGQAPFHALLRHADACLDTVGFSGFNTALEAVQCGLPIVAYEGRFMRGRFAAAIVRRLGARELIAADGDAFVAIAVRLARDRAFAAAARAQFGERSAALFRDRAPIDALEQFMLQIRPRAARR